MLCAVCRDYIMHNDDTQVIRNLARHVHNPRRDLVYNTRRDPRNRCLCMCSRDRSRRT